MANKEQEEFMHDWYAILSCDQTSTKEAIEKAARRLAIKYHPDKTSDPEAPEKFLLVQKAKEILLDETKRKLIDDQREATAKREAYEKHKNQSMDARRKRMRDEFNDRLHKASTQQPTEAEVFQNELRKRSKIIDDLRKKNSNLMEKSREDAMNKESQQTKDFLNYRKSVVENVAGGCCELKVKWKRSAESQSDETLYQMFKVFGPVEEAVLIGSKGTSGLVTFADAASAMKAYDFYKNSEDYRVSLLSGNPSSGEPLLGQPSSRANYNQQTELSGEIRRAMEKSNLMNIINQFKRPSSNNLEESDISSASINASTTGKPAIVPTTADIVSKESDILKRMVEAAARKKQALAEAKAKASAPPTGVDDQPVSG
mmetsp:Transcript_82539/g.161867  ORF Transcript_82539/g.161867 Transcript_82539/m.161867 type:complete len:372 (-) Transcript_82539:13-1128(-)